jgi:hypothetical protein
MQFNAFESFAVVVLQYTIHVISLLVLQKEALHTIYVHIVVCSYE